MIMRHDAHGLWNTALHSLALQGSCGYPVLNTAALDAVASRRHDVGFETMDGAVVLRNDDLMRVS